MEIPNFLIRKWKPRFSRTCQKVEDWLRLFSRSFKFRLDLQTLPNNHCMEPFCLLLLASISTTSKLSSVHFFSWMPPMLISIETLLPLFTILFSWPIILLSRWWFVYAIDFWLINQINDQVFFQILCFYLMLVSHEKINQINQRWPKGNYMIA